MQHTSGPLQKLVDEFVDSLNAIIMAQAREHARVVVANALGGADAGGGARRGPGRPPGSGAKAGRPPARTTAKLSKARQLQGQYLGSLRRLKGAERVRVKKVAREQGVAEAVKLAAKLAR
jgi:hypothetical protein